MRRVALFLCCFGVLALSPGTVSAASPTQVVVLKVEGAIDRPLVNYLRGRLSSAEADGSIVVLQIDTSGTIDQDGVALAQQVVDLDVPVVAWVGPAPARASGAGLLLMYAASLTAVSPGSQTGPLDPIDLADPEQDYPGLDTTIQGWLDERDKDTSLDWEDAALPAQDALDLRIATAVAQSVPELLNVIDGETVQTPSGPVTLQTRIATTEQQAGERTVDIRFDAMGPLERVAHGVSSPSMVYFLLVIGLACLAFELTQPGFGFAGFAGVGMVALAAYGIWVVPPWWPGMIALVGGVALMTLDVRLRRLGPYTVIGLIAFALGSVFAWTGVADPIAISPWLIGGAVVASLLYYGFALTVAIQSRDRIVNTQKGLIGLVGEARGRLTPEGPVYVKGAMWRGRSSGEEIDAGAKVRVRGVDGLVLRVEAEPEEVASP
ncbi:MAG TPA: NfeD family protein [Actinomycetota bacterium]